MKKVLTIQDISCYGKCSLTVALPIISAMGIETAIIPTAVLSTHTGGFEGYTFNDLTEDIIPIIKHWQSIPLTFDTIYTGYLGSKRQVDILCNILDDFAYASIKVIDPVMGDKGVLYSGFDADFAREMRKLCSRADIITPNITEACALLGMEYKENHDKEYISNLLFGLRDTGAKNCVLTGVTLKENTIGTASLGENDTEISYYSSTQLNASYPGTGDVFASVLTGAVTRGATLSEAVASAVDFTCKCIEVTMQDPNYNYSVKFEKCLSELI